MICRYFSWRAVNIKSVVRWYLVSTEEGKMHIERGGDIVA
jgi:hypothetical protein